MSALLSITTFPSALSRTVSGPPVEEIDLLIVISSEANKVSLLPFAWVFIFSSDADTVIFPALPEAASPL